MKKLAILVVAVLAVMALGDARATYAQPDTVTVTLNEQNGSGQSGTATLTMQGGTLMVTVNISGGSATAQPAHIHKGTCANLDPKPAYPLTSVVNGTSQTSLSNTTLSELVNGQFAINIHKSGAEASVYVACGDIPNMFATGGGTTGGGTTGGGTTGGEMGGGTTGGEMGGGVTVGMPATGSPDFTLIALLAVLGASLTGVGLTLARRKA